MSSRNRDTQPGSDHTAADSEALAAYVLNALEPEQQHAMQQHLQDCDICYLEYTSLGVLPGLLDSLSPEDIRELTATVTGQPASVTGARPERPAHPAHPARPARPARSWSRRRRALLAGGAFSAAMVATGFAPAYADTTPPAAHPGETAKPAPDSSAAPDAAKAAAVLTVSAQSLPEDQTALDVELRSSRALRECVLEVTTDDGARIEACRWSGTPSTRVVFSGDIPLAAARLRAVAVFTGDGTVLARQELPAGQA
ncbi:hypothetical protein ABH926_008669 [Catenulispora sp. GP43]|uniref:hypothetical protein n=1 Tax=Catenulispora sp. GP43 TaxID=3156263 RepID=UPI003513644D